ncbi:MAG: DUF1573 domain-containing protein [Bacteroidia bacterium]|nr:DUF1573 domain-containing protein [Bacteroidia bacterium]MDW8135052.1 DUF1573 domain-containing protein [Bacteroidia bacterium]
MRKLIAGVVIGMWISCTSVTKEGEKGFPSTSKDTSSQAATSPAEPPAKIRFDKMEHNFGKIREGEKVSYRFKVTNPGTVPLRITDVKPSCGCTAPAWTKEPIPPGGEGFVEVIFDSQGRSGEQIKTVTVFANTDPPSHMLRFRGEVIPANKQ